MKPFIRSSMNLELTVIFILRYKAAQGLIVTNHVMLQSGHLIRITPKLPPSINLKRRTFESSKPHQDVLYTAGLQQYNARNDTLATSPGFRRSSIPYEEFEDEPGATSEQVKVEPKIT
ncbi:hypothetical protein TNCV_1095331, partial [Trichonephila clavipes]